MNYVFERLDALEAQVGAGGLAGRAPAAPPPPAPPPPPTLPAPQAGDNAAVASGKAEASAVGAETAVNPEHCRLCIISTSLIDSAPDRLVVL